MDEYQYYLRGYGVVASGGGLVIGDFALDLRQQAALTLGVVDAQANYSGQTVAIKLFAPRTQSQVAQSIADLLA